MNEKALSKAIQLKENIDALESDIYKLEKLEYFNVHGADKNRLVQAANIRIGYIMKLPIDDKYDEAEQEAERAFFQYLKAEIITHLQFKKANLERRFKLLQEAFTELIPQK